MFLLVWIQMKGLKQLKGEDRPINSVEDRIKMLKSLKFVDDVIMFDSNSEN
jgi:bifunctional ADP-heptose synthase (sugar kinase/adenylyltransferase)